MKKIFIFAIALVAVMVLVGCTGKKETGGQTAETSEIDFGKLVLKGDVYYLNNVPFTGTAKKEDETSSETWEMKDGKFHGKYKGDEPNGSVTGYYKDGKKHGEWIEFHEPYETYNKKIEIYKDGKKHGEWKYFRVEQRWEGEELKFIDHLIKTETWENDKLIKEWEKEDGDKFTDSRDGKTYKTVKVGDKTWMAENLYYEVEGSCYDEDPDKCVVYGRLYDWATAMKACPAGYRLPSDDEWTALTDAVGGKDIAGTKLKSAEGWNNNANGTDDYGFAALPGGYNKEGSFFNVGEYGYWWSATELNSDDAYSRFMSCFTSPVDRIEYDKSWLLSVRCVKDNK